MEDIRGVQTRTATHFNTHCNTHCITHCKTHCNTHCNMHCNMHCNTGFMGDSIIEGGQIDATCEHVRVLSVLCV